MSHNSYSRPATANGHSRSATVAALAVIVAATLTVVLVYPKLAALTSSTSINGQPPAARQQDGDRSDLPRPAGRADGVVPDGVTVFDDAYPAVTNLDPDLLSALRRAASQAAQDGLEFEVNSGWRSRAYQDQLFAQAVEKYGSATKAARWVAPPGTSVHEAGKAVDLGPTAATDWLSRNGAGYGLCPIYANEPWHYELRPDAVEHGCPRMYTDATHDPRTHR
ncbi:MAG TPA: M15 family metallopeptidase [Microlunatus sp.]